MSVEIHLRPLTLGDFDEEFVGWYANEDGHLDYFTGSGRVFDRETLVEDFELGRETGRWFYYLTENDSRERIGTIKIGPIDLRNKTADLVTLIGNRAFLGQGMATRAIALGSKLAFERHDVRRLHSGIFATNIPAIKAYTRAGWFVEATFRGYYLRDGQPVDRVCVACLNSEYFSDE